MHHHNDIVKYLNFKLFGSQAVKTRILKEPKKLRQVSKGSRIPPASVTAFGKQTFYTKL